MKRYILVASLVLSIGSLSFGEYGSIDSLFNGGSVQIEGTWHDVTMQLAPFRMLSVEKITLYASSLSYGEWFIAAPSYQGAQSNHMFDMFYPIFAVYSSFDNLVSGITVYDISPRQIACGNADSQWNGPLGFSKYNDPYDLSNSNPISVRLINSSSNASLTYVGNGYDIGLEGLDDVDFWSISKFSYGGLQPIVELSYIPEPCTLLLLGVGGMLIRKR